MGGGEGENNVNVVLESVGRNAATVVQVDVLFPTMRWFGMLNMRCVCVWRGDHVLAF